MIANSKKTLLAKLYFKDYEAFNKKIDVLNISFDEIISEIEKERNRINSLKKIGNKPVRKKLSLSNHTVYRNGRPYYSAEPTSPNKKTKQKTIFIDGDNHFDEGQKGIECAPEDINVIAVFSQDGAKNKFDKKYGGRPNVSSKLVEPGSQAVDKIIKAEVERLLKKGNQDIGIVSQDKGFADCVRRNKKLDNDISIFKSVMDYLNRNNKKLE